MWNYARHNLSLRRKSTFVSRRRRRLIFILLAHLSHDSCILLSVTVCSWYDGSRRGLYRWDQARYDTIIPQHKSLPGPRHLTQGENRDPDVYYEKPSTLHESFHFLVFVVTWVLLWIVEIWEIESRDIRGSHSSSTTKKATLPSWLLPENHSAETDCNSVFLAVTCSYCSEHW